MSAYIIMSQQTKTYIMELLAAKTRRERWKARKKYRKSLGTYAERQQRQKQFGLLQYIENTPPSDKPLTREAFDAIMEELQNKYF
jgi:hypothetical protein